MAEDVAKLDLAGRHVEPAKALSAEVARVVGTGATRIVVDCTRLEFIDLQALMRLLAPLAALRAKGGDMRLFGLAEIHRGYLGIATRDDELRLAADEAQARASFEPGAPPLPVLPILSCTWLSQGTESVLQVNGGAQDDRDAEPLWKELAGRPKGVVVIDARLLSWMHELTVARLLVEDHRRRAAGGALRFVGPLEGSAGLILALHPGPGGLFRESYPTIEDALAGRLPEPVPPTSGRRPGIAECKVRKGVLMIRLSGRPTDREAGVTLLTALEDALRGDIRGVVADVRKIQELDRSVRRLLEIYGRDLAAKGTKLAIAPVRPFILTAEALAPIGPWVGVDEPKTGEALVRARSA